MYKKNILKNVEFCKKFKNTLIKLNKEIIKFPIIFNINKFIFPFMKKNNILLYKKKLNKYKELYIIVKADFENFKKRSKEDLNKVQKYAIEDFSENMLFVLDSLESALMDKSKNIERLLEGVRLTLKILVNSLEKNQIKNILPKKGDKFDPYKHLAVSTVKFENENNTIVNVLQKGYSIFDRIIRPALVIVSKV